MTGRFAPSPTGELHLGNLRTAAVAWLSSRAQGIGFIVRMEDLDRVQSAPQHEAAQLRDLAAIGIDWDGEVVRQSERFDRYEAAIQRLRDEDLVYDCYCSRSDIQRDIEASTRAPHGAPGAYPGTCRNVDDDRVTDRRTAGRPPAVRLRTDNEARTIVDRLVGSWTGPVDDVVLRRNDGVPAYNLAVVVDDALQGVTEVVRGDDLLPSTPRQALLQQLLGLPSLRYLHVPLVLGPDGERLAKSHGATTLNDLAAVGISPRVVVAWIGWSLGLIETGEMDSLSTLPDLLDRFDIDALERAAVVAPDWIGRARNSEN